MLQCVVFIFSNDFVRSNCISQNMKVFERISRCLKLRGLFSTKLIHMKLLLSWRSLHLSVRAMISLQDSYITKHIVFYFIYRKFDKISPCRSPFDFTICKARKAPLQSWNSEIAYNRSTNFGTFSLGAVPFWVMLQCTNLLRAMF